MDFALAVAILTAIGGVIRAIVEPFRIGVLLPAQTKWNLSDELISSLTLLLSALVGVGVAFLFHLNALNGLISDVTAGVLFTGVLSAVPAEIWHSLLEALGGLPRPTLTVAPGASTLQPEAATKVQMYVFNRPLPWSADKAA